ncbi:hypothetical protein [Novosphingobium sp. 9]|uniref:hypothetical protein n=1 Tax=Novosphingobium sp. 9 TaxID=2025349 RepID=UPI0021B573BF|nr:hypothetical protein [Novosphingobium sp. 9]
MTSCPATFFDFNTGYFRLNEVLSFEREEIFGDPHLVVTLRTGKRFEHRDYNGSARAIENRLLAALKAMEG